MQRRGELQPGESQPYNVDEQLAKAPTSQSGDGRTGFRAASVRKRVIRLRRVRCCTHRPQSKLACT